MTLIGEAAQSIQFAGIGCAKIRTNPRPDDPQLRLADLDWTIERTWNWLLQTMLALKLLPTENAHISRTHYELGLTTIHHLLNCKSGLTNQQSKNAWLILGREEIPDLYANLICAQLCDTERNAVIGMATVLEGHIQAISRISRDPAADHSTIGLSLTLLDMICPHGWERDKESTEDMPRWIHQRTGAGQWDFPNLMKMETIVLSGQPLIPNLSEDWSNSGATYWLPINSNIDTLLRILLQNHPLGCLSEF